MCQLCTIARIVQKRKSRSQDIQNTAQFSSTVLNNSTQNKNLNKSVRLKQK